MLCGALLSQNKDLGQIYGSNTDFGPISLILNCWYNQFQSIWTKTEWVFGHHGNHLPPSWNSKLRMKFWFKNCFRIKLNTKIIRIKLVIQFPWKPDQKFNPDLFGVKLDPEQIFEPKPHSEFRISRWLPMVAMVYKTHSVWFKYFETDCINNLGSMRLNQNECLIHQSDPNPNFVITWPHTTLII